MNKKPPIIITGMHRSGTSLFSSYLNLCGLDLGQEFVPKEKDNPKGYFEDIDFVKFHKQILKKNNTNMYLPSKIKLDLEDVSKVSNLVKSKTKKTDWGWKDPRTVIFLNLYKALDEKSKFIFIFREPLLTVDSLIRRKTEKLTKVYPLIAAQSWLWYNTKILEFIMENREKTLLFNLKDFLKHPKRVIQVVNNKFNSTLEKKNIDNVYEKKLLKKEHSYNILSRATIWLYKNNLNNLYHKLKTQKANL